MPGMTLEAVWHLHLQSSPFFFKESHALLSKLRNSSVISIIVGLGVGKSVGKTALLG
jgi:hypothetical protein